MAKNETPDPAANPASEETSRLSPKTDSLRRPAFPTEERVCAECGTRFQAATVEVRGVKVITDKCPRCWRKAVPVSLQMEFKAPPDPIPLGECLERMNRIGVNIRKHGHLELRQLGLPQVERFAEEVISAGQWVETSALYLSGPTGTGKSQATASVIRELLTRGVPERSIVYDRARAMVTQLQDCYNTGTVDTFSQTRRRAILWAYDDAGAEKLTADAFRVIEDLLDAREGHPTILASNMTREEYAKRWANVAEWERLRSRLAPYEVVYFDGTDRRFSKRA